MSTSGNSLGRPEGTLRQPRSLSTLEEGSKKPIPRVPRGGGVLCVTTNPTTESAWSAPPAATGSGLPREIPMQRHVTLVNRSVHAVGDAGTQDGAWMLLCLRIFWPCGYVGIREGLCAERMLILSADDCFSAAGFSLPSAYLSPCSVSISVLFLDHMQPAAARMCWAKLG